MTRWLFVGALVVSAGFPVLASAQARPVALDFTVGLDDSRARSKGYTDTKGLTAEFTFSWRSHPEAQVTRVAALAAGGRGSPAGSDKCVFIDPAAGFAGGCADDAPALAHLGFLAGIEQVTRGSSGRVLIGPAFFAGEGSSGLGAQAQLDAAFPGRSHLAFVASLRGSAIRRFSGESLGLLGLSFGVRFQ